MSEPMTAKGIEDILASVRRLVSAEVPAAVDAHAAAVLAGPEDRDEAAQDADDLDAADRGDGNQDDGDQEGVDHDGADQGLIDQGRDDLDEETPPPAVALPPAEAPRPLLLTPALRVVSNRDAPLAAVSLPRESLQPPQDVARAAPGAVDATPPAAAEEVPEARFWSDHGEHWSGEDSLPEGLAEAPVAEFIPFPVRPEAVAGPERDALPAPSELVSEAGAEAASEATAADFPVPGDMAHADLDPAEPDHDAPAAAWSEDWIVHEVFADQNGDQDGDLTGMEGSALPAAAFAGAFSEPLSATGAAAEAASSAFRGGDFGHDAAMGGQGAETGFPAASLEEDMPSGSVAGTDPLPDPAGEEVAEEVIATAPEEYADPLDAVLAQDVLPGDGQAVVGSDEAAVVVPAQEGDAVEVPGWAQQESAGADGDGPAGLTYAVAAPGTAFATELYGPDAGDWPPEPEAPLPAHRAETAPALSEEHLQLMVRDLIREELQGALGERITRNIRKLVRAEIARALSVRELE